MGSFPEMHTDPMKPHNPLPDAKKGLIPSLWAMYFPLRYILEPLKLVLNLKVK